MAKELLKEAIADAKAVREVALQNAKMALEEAFDSKIKNMLSAKLAEELEEDVELEETYMEDEKDEKSEAMSYDEDDKVDEAKDDKEDMDEAYMEDDKDEVDEEINLDELMAELEEVSNEDTMFEEDEKDEDMKEGKDDEKDEDMKEGIGDKIAGTLKGIGKSFNLLSTPDETARDLRKSLLKNPELKNDEKFMSMLKAVEAFAGAAAGAGSARRAEGVEENFDIDALVAEIESSLDEETVDEGATGYDEKVGGKGRTGFDEKVGGKGRTGYDGAVKKLEEERDEALETVASLQETISEMNLLNSKLLYCNKLFRANALTEAQKVKVVDALDMANTANEAKLVFNTLQESFNFTGVEKRAIKEGLGRASKASGNAPKKVITESVDETVSRFQKLANIKF
jgi:hypothetical protein